MDGTHHSSRTCVTKEVPVVHTARESRCGHRLVGVFALMRKITGLFMKSCLPLLLSVLLLLPFLPAASGALGWTDMMGPGNGSGRALVYDSVRGNLYRGTYSRGVWRYKSGAYTDMGLGNTNISDSAYDSANNILYVLSGAPSPAVPILTHHRYGPPWEGTHNRLHTMRRETSSTRGPPPGSGAAPRPTERRHGSTSQAAWGLATISGTWKWTAPTTRCM